MTQLAPHLRTGLIDVDAEHERLFALLDGVRRLCTRHGSPNCLACASHKRDACRYLMLDLLDDLIGVAIEHFSHEEVEYAAILSPENLERHRQAHREMVRWLRATFAACQAGENILATQHAESTHEALERHLIEFDLPLHDAQRFGGAEFNLPSAAGHAVFSAATLS